MIEPLLAYSWGDFWGHTEPVLAHVVSWLIIVAGIAGTVLPILPGPPLIFVGALVHRLWVGGEATLTIFSLVALGVLAILSLVVEYGAGIAGARKYGSSKWGAWGSLIGCIVGLIFFSLPGMIIGTLIGAFAAEMIVARKELKPAARSSWGAVVGTVLGTLSKGVFTVVMMAWIMVDMWVL